MKQTKDIIQQMEKEFDDRFKFAGTYAMGELQADNIKSFIHSYTKSLLSAFAEELVGEDEVVNPYLSIGQDGFVKGKNRLRKEQRLKAKEIIEGVGK